MTISDASNVIPLYCPAPCSEETLLDEHLEALAEQVRNASRSSAASIIAIGKALIEAKQHLEHGQFCQWVSQECHFTIRSAQNYLRAAKLTIREGEIISRLTPAAMYRLASPKTSRKAVTYVVELLHKGFVPTEAELIGSSRACRTKPKNPPPQRKRLAINQRSSLPKNCICALGVN